MNHIWKAPWGRHIDLSRILEVTDMNPPEEYLDRQGANEFGIQYQLMDKPVFINWMNIPVQIVDVDWKKVNSFREALLVAWATYKGEI